MLLIKLYRQMVEHRKETLRRLESNDHVWLYCNSDKDGVIVKQIIEIEKKLK